MSSLRTALWLVLAGAAASACTTTTTERLKLPPLVTVESVDLDRYMGRWFEIASYPQSFQKGCHGTTATYELQEGGEVKVTNRCFRDSLSGKESVAVGRARLHDPAGSTAQLEVSFFGPFWGDYWVIELDPDYRYAVVGHPGRDYLWILSRTPQLDDETYAHILERLQALGYPLDRLEKTEQPLVQSS